jgi:hypothetical protein
MSRFARPGPILVGVLLLAAVGITQWLQRRPDPAAEPGVRIAAVLLLEADAALRPSADPGQRAEQAALLRRTWDDAAAAARLARLQASPDEPGRHGAVRFVVSHWEDVDAAPHRARAVLVGHYEWSSVDRRWQVELTRQDPVGLTRGWRLLSVTATD